jgi:hypothetical protein
MANKAKKRATGSKRKSTDWIREEDIAVQEDQYGGPIADRTKEYLGTSDAGIIALRRRLLNAVRNLQAGQEPRESHCGGAYRVHPTASLMHREILFNEVARSAIPKAFKTPNSSRTVVVNEGTN